jgi:hypothetical protein
MQVLTAVVRVSLCANACWWACAEIFFLKVFLFAIVFLSSASLCCELSAYCLGYV